MALPEVGARIVVKGGDQAAAEVQKLTKAFESAKAHTLEAGNAIAGGGVKASQQLRQMGLHTLEAESAANRLREAFHVAHPILETAGLGLGNLGAFARLAGAGLGALGVAIAGSVLIGIEKLSDQTARAKKRLTDLGTSNKDFIGLRKTAGELGLGIDDVTNSVENLAKARGAAGGPNVVLNPRGPKLNDVTPEGARVFGGRTPAQTGADLLKLTTLGGGNTETAKKDLEAITSGLGASGGRLNAGIVDQLSAGTARQLLQLFGQPFLPGSRLTPQQQLGQSLGPQGRPFTELQSRLAQAEPRLDKELAARGPGDLGDAFAHLTSATETLVGDFHALAAPVEGLANLIGRFAAAPPSPEEHAAQFANRFRPRVAAPIAGRLTDDEFQALSRDERFRRRYEPRGLPRALQLPTPPNAITVPSPATVTPSAISPSSADEQSYLNGLLRAQGIGNQPSRSLNFGNLNIPDHDRAAAAAAPAPIPEVNITVPVSIDGHQITEAVVRDAVRTLRRSTGDKSAAW